MRSKCKVKSKKYKVKSKNCHPDRQIASHEILCKIPRNDQSCRPEFGFSPDFSGKDDSNNPCRPE
jgi:hypothetical protein